MLTTDPKATVRRTAALERYYRASVLRGGDFLCTHAEACHRSHGGTFYEGQLHHVGRHFDLMADGRHLRIVVVGQEYGHGPDHVSSAERSKKISDTAEAGFLSRNPHMQGTTSALRVLLGRDPGSDPEGEWIAAGAERIHLFDAFAMVDYLLCSATDGSMRGCATEMMLTNCASHFRAFLEILEPTLLVCQGKGFFWYVAEALGVPHQKEVVFKFRLGDTDGLGVCFNHPSAPRWDWGWAHLDQPYLADVVVPTLRRMVAAPV